MAARSICSTRRGRARSARSQPSVIFHCAGLPHVAESWAQRRRARCRSTPSARTTCSTPSVSRPRTPASSSPAPRSSTGQSDRAAERRRSARPDGSVRRQQTRAGDGRRLRADDAGRARRVRSTTSGPGSNRPSSRRASPGRSPRSKRDAASRCCGSATSMRGATSPTSATPCGRTKRSPSRGTAGRLYNICSRRRASGRRRAGHAGRRWRGCGSRVQQDPARHAAERQSAGARRSVADPAETGWTPEIPIERTLADLLAWWRTQVARP